MSIISKKPQPTLTEQLEAKQAELEDTAIDKSDEAAQLAELAAEAKHESSTASRHAEAVSAARAILSAAGVSL